MTSTMCWSFLVFLKAELKNLEITEEPECAELGFNYRLLRLIYCWTDSAPVFPRGLVGVTKGWLLWLWSVLSSL